MNTYVVRIQYTDNSSLSFHVQAYSKKGVLRHLLSKNHIHDDGYEFPIINTKIKTIEITMEGV